MAISRASASLFVIAAVRVPVLEIAARAV